MAENLFDGERLSIPFVRHLGFVLKKFQDGEARIEYDLRPEHMNSYQVAHGGLVMTLLDVGMAHAARSVQPDMGLVTIEMKTSFMQPARGRIAVEARLIHRTATLAFVEGTVRDGTGRPCAHGTGTFKYMRRLAVGPKDVHDRTVVPTD